MASGEEAVEPLKYKKWVLKVSIHCEGCKRKVRKVLQSIDGVYTTVVDSQLHKVTVTGNVEVDILIKKLVRTGKRVEIWPEKTNKEKENKNGGGKNNGNDKKVKEKGKEQKPSAGNVEKDFKSSDEPAAGKPTSKNADAVAGKASNGKKGEAKSTSNNSTPPPPQEEKKTKQQQQQKQQSGSDGGDDIQKEKPNSGGDGGKKKGKENPNENTAGNTNANAMPNTPDGGKDVTAGYTPLSNLKPYQGGYPQFPMYLPTPVYAMSYNMTHPTPSYGYYAAPPPEPMPYNNHLYSHCNNHPAGAYSYHYPPTGATLLPASSASYDDFSEEKGDACSIM